MARFAPGLVAEMPRLRVIIFQESDGGRSDSMASSRAMRAVQT